MNDWSQLWTGDLAATKTWSYWQLQLQLCEARLAGTENARAMREQVTTGLAALGGAVWWWVFEVAQRDVHTPVGKLVYAGARPLTRLLNLGLGTRAAHLGKGVFHSLPWAVLCLYRGFQCNTNRERSICLWKRLGYSPLNYCIKIYILGNEERQET